MLASCIMEEDDPAAVLAEYGRSNPPSPAASSGILTCPFPIPGVHGPQMCVQEARSGKNVLGTFRDETIDMNGWNLNDPPVCSSILSQELLEPDHSGDTQIASRPFLRTKRVGYSSFLTRFRPSLLLLQFSGMYPRSLPYNKTRVGNYQFRHFLISSGFLAINVACCAVNSTIIGLVIWVVIEYWKEFGLWYPETVCAIITGMKPLQSTINLIIFALMRNRHKKLLRCLDNINAAVVEDFGIAPNVRHINLTMISFAASMFCVTFIIRTAEYLLTVFFTPVYLDSNSSNSWLFEYLPFVLLPLFSVWQALPLIYFMILTALVRFWLGNLIKSLNADPKLEKHGMALYFEHFCRLTVFQRKLGNVFSLFILFSLGLCILTLCLTVYFVTQTKHIVPEDSDVVFYFNFVWSTLQIAVLMTYLVSICITGFKTNEKSRKILQAALTTKPTNQHDRFQIFCLSEKIHLQYGWGISVWRGFLIERGLLFTIVGLIITYALVLLRMKPHESCIPSAKGDYTSPVGGDSSFLNATTPPLVTIANGLFTNVTKSLIYTLTNATTTSANTSGIITP